MTDTEIEIETGIEIAIVEGKQHFSSRLSFRQILPHPFL